MSEFSDQGRDEADMERLAAGHEAALNDLMERHGPKLFHYLIRSLQNEDDAADLAQETFVRVFQNRNKFDSKQKFSTWLYAIASNLIKDRFRYRSRHSQVSIDAENDGTGSALRETLEAPNPIPRDELESEERSAMVRGAVAELPDELRTPLILSQYEELPHSAIAEILRCTPKAVETRIYRARQHLRKALNGLFRNQ